MGDDATVRQLGEIIALQKEHSAAQKTSDERVYLLQQERAKDSEKYFDMLASTHVETYNMVKESTAYKVALAEEKAARGKAENMVLLLNEKVEGLRETVDIQKEEIKKKQDEKEKAVAETQKEFKKKQDEKEKAVAETHEELKRKIEELKDELRETKKTKPSREVYCSGTWQLAEITKAIPMWKAKLQQDENYYCRMAQKHFVLFVDAVLTNDKEAARREIAAAVTREMRIATFKRLLRGV